MCAQRQWNSSRLLLALPYSNERPKATVRLQTYVGNYRDTSVLQWVYKQVGKNVRNLQKKNELAAWLETSCVADVCFLLVSTLTLPPFFLSALSVKFTGRAKFATTSPDAAATISSLSSTSTEESDAERRHVTSQAPVTSQPLNGRYWLLTPQGRTRYADNKSGKRYRFEQLKFTNLYSFLRWFAPDLNDLFVFSLALVNLCAVVSIFDLRGSPSQAVFHFAWTLVKYNTLLLLGWIILLGLAQRRTVISIGRVGLGAVRRFSLSAMGRVAIGDLQWLANHTSAFIGSFFAFNGLVYFVRRRFFPHTLEEPEPWSEWFRLQRPVVVLNPGRPTIYRSRSPEFDPRVRTLIRQLGLYEYTINPSLAFDFLFELPVWSFEAKYPMGYGRSRAGKLCVRCRCVRGLNLKNLARKLAKRPCSHCGFAGNLKSAEFSRGKQILNEDDELLAGVQACPICLEPYQKSDLICGLPCDHSYHRKCILSWLITDPHQTCPCCRWPAYIEKEKIP